MKWTRRHVMDTDDWSREEIETVLDQTRAMTEILRRPIRRAPPLRGRTVILFFAEASTRTRVSFELAAKALSADVTNISASGSSVEKGESLYATVRTLQALGGDVDAVIALRLQRERQESGLLPSLREYSRVWGLTAERVARMRPGAPVMHPGPMNEGVEIDAAVAHGTSSLIETQVTNGVAVRMALLYLLAGAPAPSGAPTPGDRGPQADGDSA